MQVNLCPPRTRFIPKVSGAASVNSGGQEASLERDYGRTVVERSRLKGRRTIYTIYSETLLAFTLTWTIKKIRDQLRRSRSSSVAHAIWSLSQLHSSLFRLEVLFENECATRRERGLKRSLEERQGRNLVCCKLICILRR